jgi:hypothetical protein
VGQNLARNSDAKVPFTFRVIDGEELNAFALPGGYVFVYTGLIKLASEEDEFAGALAHEIAHVAARHMTCRASEQQMAKAASIVPGILLGGLGGYAARQAANAAIPMTVFELQPARRVGGRLPGRAVHVRRGVRSDGRGEHFRKAGSAAEDAAGGGGASAFDAPHGFRADQ